MSEWISVEERLPRCGKRVLVTEGNGVFEAFLSISHNWVRLDIGWAEGVTHWMPLPEPPATVSETERVRCGDCKHLMYSDCYGECGAVHRGIVRPDDTCPHGERRADDE